MLRAVGFGVLGLIVVVIAIATISHWLWDRSIASEMASLEADALRQDQVVVAEMLAGLPRPVQRYLLNAGVVGKPIPTTVRLTQTGRIRNSPDAEWMSFEAEEVYTTNPPGFVWRAWLPGQSAPIVMGRDIYLGGRSSIVMRMLGLLPVAEQSGDELSEAGLMRYLNEIMWFPMAYLDDAVTWEPIDEHSARITITDQGLSVSAMLYVDDDGRLTNFSAERFNTETGRMESWETPVTDYAEFNGLKLPVAGQGVWAREGGDFAYIELEVTGIVFE